MLVLTRSRDEEIRIGDDVVVRVLDVKGDRVRIGIQAPTSVSVHREEVYAEIVRTNRESLQIAGDGLREAGILAAAAPKKGKPKIATKTDGESEKGKSRAKRVSTEVIHGA